MNKKTSLIQLAKLSEIEARKTLERIRWAGKPVCPHCDAVDESTELNGSSHRPGLYQCNSCRGQYTVKTKTVMHRSKISYVDWLCAFYMICSSKKGVSSLQVQRQLGLGSYKTAWFLTHRIRYAMEAGEFGKMGKNGGIAEADETYVGGKPRRDGKKRKAGRGTTKTPLLTLVDRETGRAFSRPIIKVSRDNVEPIIK